ncbi:hypothetical protein LBMAG42_21940 [Deltaproteobacteria bacterium]|nr:hypothetical protein LBMAG42_21940 [Deltaproteobacteria bacterium]
MTSKFVSPTRPCMALVDLLAADEVRSVTATSPGMDDGAGPIPWFTGTFLAIAAPRSRRWDERFAVRALWCRDSVGAGDWTNPTRMKRPPEHPQPGETGALGRRGLYRRVC